MDGTSLLQESRKLKLLGRAMRRLSETDLHILAVVAKHEPVCIGIPVDEQWAPIAKGLERLSRPNLGLLIREDFDDGPTYSISPAGRAKLGE